MSNSLGKVFVPGVLLSNVMSLAPKIDEIRHCVIHANVDVVCLTETWLREHIDDNVVSIGGFNLVRLDRKTRMHGGVCMYIKDSIQFSLLDDLIHPSYEALWILIRPKRLPRGISSIVIDTVNLKNLIKRRQRALAQGNSSEFRILRNRVNRERKICRARYYEAKVAHLKDCKPSLWWKEVKKLSGMSSASGRRDGIIESLQHIDGVSNAEDLANAINDSFIIPMRDYPPLPAKFQPKRNTPSSHLFAVSHHSVYMKMSTLNVTKAEGPDGIPAWLLKENADILAKPIADILNSSYWEGKLPSSWKSADIVPVPKQKPAKDVNKDLRPISLTPILSKVAEEFYRRMLNQPY